MGIDVSWRYCTNNIDFNSKIQNYRFLLDIVSKYILGQEIKFRSIVYATSSSSKELISLLMRPYGR